MKMSFLVEKILKKIIIVTILPTKSSKNVFFLKKVAKKQKKD